MSRQISISPLAVIDLTIGQSIPCYNSQGEMGRVVYQDGQVLCSCGEPVVKMTSSTDPGRAVACNSIYLHKQKIASTPNYPDYQPGCRPSLHS